MNSRLSEALKAVLLASGTVLFSVLVVEVAMRVAGYYPRLSMPDLLRSEARRYAVPDRSVIMIKPAFLSDDHYEVNSGRTKIVALGDSFTASFPVAAVDSYPNIMAQVLRERGCNVDVIDMGMGNSGPDQHLYLMKNHVLPRLRPDLVVWQFYRNDIGDNQRQAVYGIEKDALVPLEGSHWLYIRQRLFENIPLPVEFKERSPVIGLFFAAMQSVGDWRIPRGDRDDWSKRKIRLAIQEMNALASAHRFDVWYVLVAPQSQYKMESGEPLGKQDERFVREHQEMFEMLESQPKFISAWFGESPAPARDSDSSGERMRAANEIFADGDRDRNDPGDRHFNEAGYRLLAEAVAARVQESCHSFGGASGTAASLQGSAR